MLPSSPPEVPKSPRHTTPKRDKCPIVECLPPEILGYIFEIGTRAEETDKGWDGVRNVNYGLDGLLSFPARVVHVCRRWRSIAIDTSTLWTELDFMEPRPFEKSKVWLERSKKAPLGLSIDLNPVEDRIDVYDTDDQDDENQEDRSRLAEQHLDCILDLIIPHVSHWRSFQLSVNSCKHMYSALERLRKCPADPGAPILQAFVLYCNEEPDDLTTQQYSIYNLPFGGHAPMLTQAVFWGAYIDWKLLIPPSERSAFSSSYSTPTFTTNLTDLEFLNHRRYASPSYEEFKTIIRCAPNLTSLQLDCSGPDLPQQGYAAQPIFLPNLRYLQIGFVEEEERACALLRLLYAPALKSVSFNFGGAMYDTFVRQLAAPMPLPDPQSLKVRDLIFLPSSPNSSLSSSSLSETEENGRFVNPREPKSILHNVTEVNLFCMACLSDSLQRFYSASPHLKCLSFSTTCPQDPEDFSIVMDDPAIPGCQGSDSITNLSLSSCSIDTSNPTASHPIMPLCKHLESLTISGIPGDQLIRFVKKRKAQGIPIQELTICNWQLNDEEESWLIANVRRVNIV